MDILVSSNLERLLYLISGNNNELVKDLMADLKEKGKYEINKNMKSILQDEFYGGCVFKEETEKTIKTTFEQYNYLLDTHTAVAFKALNDYKNETGDRTVSVVLSTASPFKFSGSVYEALFGSSEKSEFEIMKELAERTKVEIPVNLRGLENKKVLHKSLCEVDEMKDFVLKVVME